MGPSKLVVIKSKAFEVIRDGRHVHLTERSWGVVKGMSLGLATALWLTKALENCLKVGRREFYTAHQEGDRSFIAQQCSNSRGYYMALVQYGGGG